MSTSALMRQCLAILALGGAVALSCGSLSEGTQYFVAHAMVLAIFAVGYDLVFGVGGMLSLGHAAFFGLGSYLFGWLTLEMGWGVLPAMAVAIAGATVLAGIFGALALRTSGVQLALTTLALAQLVQIVIEIKLKDHTGGSDGLPGVPRPEWFGIDFLDSSAFFLLVCAVMTVALLANALLRHSPFGKVLDASRQNPVRVAQMGYSVNRYRLAAFMLSGVYAGLAGVLMASLTMFVGPDSLRWTTSGDILIMTILGGAGTLFGPVIGVVVFEVIKELGSHFTSHWYGVLGIFFIATTLLMPGGLIGLVRSVQARLARPRQRSAVVVTTPADTVKDTP